MRRFIGALVRRGLVPLGLELRRKSTGHGGGRVKWCGKSAPRCGCPQRQGKPRWEQDQAGRSREPFPARVGSARHHFRVGC